ncbi:MAG: DUF815 domain-containing protein [Desulfobacterales bacterium]|nr:DUF815 domain-containing protein [Desulfobacterales bacterium]
MSGAAPQHAGFDIFEAPRLDLLRGIDAQKATVAGNVARLAGGHEAHDMLLWGARGIGRSACLRAAVNGAQQGDPGRIALVQAGTDALDTLAALFAELGKVERNFLVFIDDLGFAEGDSVGPRHLRSWLERHRSRPGNVRLAVTSNRRAIVPRGGEPGRSPEPRATWSTNRLALADRFGLSLGFHDPARSILEIVGAVQRAQADAGRGPRMVEAPRRAFQPAAWQFVTELAGRAGKRF